MNALQHQTSGILEWGGGSFIVLFAARGKVFRQLKGQFASLQYNNSSTNVAPIFWRVGTRKHTSFLALVKIETEALLRNVSVQNAGNVNSTFSLWNFP